MSQHVFARCALVSARLSVFLSLVAVLGAPDGLRAGSHPAVPAAI
jgi:hypothetical protein